MMKSWRRIAISATGAVAIIMSLTSPVAAQYASSNYQTNEVFFGNGGALNVCSSSYCSQQAIGEIGVGNSSSATYQANSGFNTSDAPVLELNVSGGIFDLGLVDASATKSTSTTFSVRSYLSHGYIVELVGTPPINGFNGHTINNLTTPTAATAGVEQFGVNVVANTTPSVGAAPQQLPDSSFSFGTAATGYNTSNQFKFVSGDTIAQSTSSSGQTLFTLSVILDVSNATPAGEYGALDGLYGGSLYLIVVPTF
jgi:hypothetical protein